MNWKGRLTVGIGREVRLGPRTPAASGIAMPVEAERRAAYFGNGAMVPTPVYRGGDLRPGQVVQGPAIIEEPTTTIVVYKRSWRDFLGPLHQNVRNASTECSGLWKVPQLWKSESVAFGSFFLMISTSCLESTKRFPHFPPGPTTMKSMLLRPGETKTFLPDLTLEE